MVASLLLLIWSYYTDVVLSSYAVAVELYQCFIYGVQFTVPHSISAFQQFIQPILLNYFIFSAVWYSTYEAHLSFPVYSTLHNNQTCSRYMHIDMCSQAYILQASTSPVIHLNTLIGTPKCQYMCVYRYFGICLVSFYLFSGVFYSPQ